MGHEGASGGLSAAASAGTGPGTPVGARLLLGGGIGAGKTSVGDVFVERGFIRIVADAVGHEALRDPEVSAAVRREWPEAVAEGTVVRPRLAEAVFGDRDALARLESITHPWIGRIVRERVRSAGAADLVVETPLMGIFDDLGAVRIAVVAEEGLRRARAVARGASPDDVDRRMAMQAGDDAWRAWADIVIANDGPWSETRAVVDALIDTRAWA